MDMRTHSVPTVSDDHATKKRRVLKGIDVPVIAVAVWFSDSYVDKAPSEDAYMLRKHIYRRLFYGSEANCYDQLRFTKHVFHKFVNIL